MTTRARVAAVRTTPETVLEDYKRLLDLAKVENVLDKSATTILKDNISWHKMFPAANTTPWQLEGTIKALKDKGFNDLVCVENRTVVTNAYKGEKLNKLDVPLKKYDVPVKYNFKKADMGWKIYEPKAKLTALPRIFPEGFLIPDFFEGKNIVHLPTIKCHIYTTITGALKNAFGGLLNTKRHYTHSCIHETIVDLLAVQKEIHPGIFCVMDGTTAGNGPGPRTMFPEVKNILLASDDQVAIDSISAKMQGFDPMSLKFIRLAHERGLGVGEPSEIEVVGDDISGESWGFEVGKNLTLRVGGTFWFSPLKFLQYLMFRTPIVYFFILGSFIYHDYVWYPLIGKKRVNKWKKTPWGKLFDQY